MSRLASAALVFASVAWLGAAMADAPLRPPERTRTCSVAGTWCAISDPGRGITEVVSSSSGNVLWSIAGWHRSLYVSNDGGAVAVGHPGLGLLPKDVALSETILRFHAARGPIREVRLGDLFASLSELVPTASHLKWGQVRGVGADGALVVELVDGRTLAFALSTGKPAGDGD